MLNYLKQKENANTWFIKSNNTSSVKKYLMRFQMHISIKAMVIFPSWESKLQFSEKEKFSVFVIQFFSTYTEQQMCVRNGAKKKKSG